MKKHLFVVAHPDDEVLGAGAFIYDAIRRGDKVAVAVLNNCDTTRYQDDETRIVNDLERSHAVLGVASAGTCSTTPTATSITQITGRWYRTSRALSAIFNRTSSLRSTPGTSTPTTTGRQPPAWRRSGCGSG